MMKSIPCIICICTCVLFIGLHSAHASTTQDANERPDRILDFNEIAKMASIPSDLAVLAGETGSLYQVPIDKPKSLFELRNLPSGYSIVLSLDDEVHQQNNAQGQSLVQEHPTRFDALSTFVYRSGSRETVSNSKVIGKQLFFDDGLTTMLGRGASSKVKSSYPFVVTESETTYGMMVVFEGEVPRTLNLLLFPIVPTGIVQRPKLQIVKDLTPLRLKTLTPPYPFALSQRHQYTSELHSAELDSLQFLLPSLKHSRSLRVDLDLKCESIEWKDLSISFEICVQNHEGLTILFREMQSYTKEDFRLLDPDAIWSGHTLEFACSAMNDWKLVRNTSCGFYFVPAKDQEYIIQISGLRINTGTEQRNDAQWRIAVRD